MLMLPDNQMIGTLRLQPKDHNRTFRSQLVQKRPDKRHHLVHMALHESGVSYCCSCVPCVLTSVMCASFLGCRFHHVHFVSCMKSGDQILICPFWNDENLSEYTRS